MPAPITAAEFLDLVLKSRVIDPARLAPVLKSAPAAGTPDVLAARLRDAGLLTTFQAAQLLRGKFRRLLVGRYRILDRLGTGGSGEVLLAEHLDMKRRAALKVLPRDKADDPFARERFLREARAAGQLDHPHLVRAFDAGEDGGTVFLAMEYVDGLSLQDLVDRGGPLDPARAADYLRQAARGLGYLADRGLVHRDVKPANLLVDRSGVVKVLDLGLVRSEDEKDDLTRRAGAAVIGTADYLAPEQAMSSQVDARADVYSLGATGFFLLTGRPPFHQAGTTARKLIAHQVSPAARADAARPEVPAGLADVVARMLAKSPAGRFQTPAEVEAALAPWADAQSAGELPAEAPLADEVVEDDHEVRAEPAPTRRPQTRGVGPVRRRVSLALAFSMTLAVAAWDVAVLSGAVPRPAVARPVVGMTSNAHATPADR
jgi:serine/threonine protein kinase